MFDTVAGPPRIVKRTESSSSCFRVSFFVANPDYSRTHGSTRRIRVENRAPQAGKTRLRLIVGGTRRAATGPPACTNRTPGAPARPVRPTPHFSCDHDGLLRRFPTRTRRVAEKVRA